MAAERYARVEASAQVGSAYWAVGELYMAEERNGPNVLTPSTTITSSSTAFGFPASGAIDGSRSNFFHSDTSPTPHWLQVDFGTNPANWRDVNEIRIVPRGNQFITCATALKLRTSPDASTWTDKIDISGYTGWQENIATAWQSASCPPGADGALFWRWNFTDSDLAAIAGVEAQMRESIGGADVISSTTDFFYATSVDGANYPANLFDNNTGTLWSSNFTEVCQVQVECSQKRNIVEVAWTARSDSNFYLQSPNEATIDYSYDRQNWTTAIVITGQPDWTAGETRTFSGGGSVGGGWVPRVMIL